MEIKQNLRQINIDGAPKIGEGAHGEVYRIAEDTIVKVYRPFVLMEDIRKEKELARWAFVKGVPTAISYDIVRVGDSYGVVYELLDACSAADYVNESPENLEDFVKKSVDLMHQIHSIEVAPGELPDMKEKTYGWIEKCRQYMPSKVCDRVKELLDRVPDSHTLLHADFHLKNIMVSKGELMLIDMDTMSAGDPVFELATICNSYMEFPSISPEAAYFLGIDVATANCIWNRTLEIYMEGSDPATVKETAERARIFGCIRILDYIDRHKDAPDREKCIKTCIRDIEELCK